MDKIVEEELQQEPESAEANEEKAGFSDESTILLEVPTHAATENEERYERLKQEKTVSRYYKGKILRKSIWLFLMFTVLLETVTPGMVPVSEMDWLSRLVLGLVIMEMVLLYFKELYVTGAIVTVAVGMLVMIRSRLYTLHFALLFGVFMGCPAVIAAGVGATFFWSLLKLYGLAGWLSKLMVGPLECVVFLLAMWTSVKVKSLSAEYAEWKNGSYEQLLEEDGAEE